MADMNLPAGLLGGVLGTLPASDVSDEGKAAGLAFGELIRKTGEAVAETQKLLNHTSAESATALANTMVEVVAVEEKTYDALGNLSTSKAHTMELPLVNFIDPTFYRWSQVRLQGEFVAREFSGQSDTGTDTASSSSNVGIKLGGLFGFGYASGSGSYSSANTSTDTKTTDTEDYSYGRIRAAAQLNPRPDVVVPRPNQVIQGPRLSVLPADIHDIPTDGKITGRVINVLFSYNRASGEPIQGKTLAIDAQGLAWDYTNPAKKTTDENGMVQITIHRDIPLDGDGKQGDTSIKEFVVTARIGIVSNSTTIKF
jgi:hypothetical protein